MAARVGRRQHEPDAEPDPEPAPALPHPVVALQQAAGNAAVARWLSREPAAMLARDTAPGKAPPPPAKAPAGRVSYVFLMGDTQGDSFYIAAREFFLNKVKNATMVLDKRTLAEVIQHVNSGGKPVDTLYIVSHASQDGTLGFSVDDFDLKEDRQDPVDDRPDADFGEIKASRERGRLPKADTKLIDDKTKIEIKGCSIGRGDLTLDELDRAFGGKASVTAPTHAQEYRVYKDGMGGFTYEENLSEMFIEEAGVADKSKPALGAAFKAKYPMIPKDKWPGLLASATREATDRPRFTHTQPNPPDNTEKAVKAHLDADRIWPKAQRWTVKFTGRTKAGTKWRYELQAKRPTPDGGYEEEEKFFYVDIPPTDDALIAQEKAKHGRPDAYRWSTKRKVVGDQLEIDVIASRTEWMIPNAIRDATGPIHPPESDTAWYRTSTAGPPAPSPPPKP